jgi:hypothetical protein
MTTIVTLTATDTASISNAIQLVRDAGFEDEADLLDEFLAGNDISLKYGMGSKLGQAEQSNSYRWFGAGQAEIYLKPSLLLGRKMVPCDPELVLLASVLLHEARHMQGKSEAQSYGSEVSFCKKIMSDADALFPGATPAQRTAKVTEARNRHAGASLLREKYRDSDDGKSRTTPKQLATLGDARVGWGQESSTGPTRMTRDDFKMRRIADALYDLHEETGRFPTGSLDDAVARLVEAGLWPKAYSENKAALTDSWGRPFVFNSPGKIFPRAFDLYSLGPDGEDRGGGFGNIICAVERSGA